MRTYPCLCGQTLFFENRFCGSCGRTAGWCDACHRLTVPTDAGQCSYEDCRANLSPCGDRIAYDVCNGFLANEQAPDSSLCSSCQLTTDIPDATNPTAVAAWARLEAAKRRLLDELRTIGYSAERLSAEPPLRFRFLADTPREHVVTGHADGVITVNLAETDPVKREVARQRFREPQRTIIGHMRHEFGHFFWMREVEQAPALGAFCEVFGDFERPPYAEALDQYHENGPPKDWQTRYISRYAAAHPWEDFAETFGFYLDMRAVLDTLAWQIPHLVPSTMQSLAAVLSAYQRAGVLLNEVNRTMGLSDLVPEVVSPPVVAKLDFVHGLVQQAAAAAGVRALAG